MYLFGCATGRMRKTSCVELEGLKVLSMPNWTVEEKKSKLNPVISNYNA